MRIYPNWGFANFTVQPTLFHVAWVHFPQHSFHQPHRRPSQGTRASQSMHRLTCFSVLVVADALGFAGSGYRPVHARRTVLPIAWSSSHIGNIVPTPVDNITAYETCPHAEQR